VLAVLAEAVQAVQTQDQPHKALEQKVVIVYLLQQQQLAVDLAGAAQAVIQAAQADHQAAQAVVADQLLLLLERHKDQAVV
jgi:hypothetical protein